VFFPSMLGAGDVINCYKCCGNGMTVMVYQMHLPKQVFT